MCIYIHRLIEHLSDHAINARKVGRYRSTLETESVRERDTRD